MNPCMFIFYFYSLKKCLLAKYILLIMYFVFVHNHNASYSQIVADFTFLSVVLTFTVGEK